MKFLLCYTSYRDNNYSSKSFEISDFAEAVKQFNEYCASHHVKSVTLADLEKKTIIRQFIYRSDTPVLL